MKIIHTSDWHVGRTLRGRSRADEHEAVLTEVAGLARDERADLVLVTGDLFDAAAPTADAERIVYKALLDLAATGATVVVLAGNHDSERRLQAVEPLLGLGRIVTRATFARPDDGGVLELETEAGERAIVALLPFLSQRYVVRADELMSGEAADHADAYAARMQRLIGVLCEPFRTDTVNIVAAHLMAAGGVLGGGERSAHTIFEYAVPATAFPASAHYAALGHLHRPQKIAGACPIWYAGSPLQLDFGEVGDEKATIVINAVSGRPAQIRAEPIAAGRRLRTVAGTMAELAGLARTIDPDAYLKVVVRERAKAGLAEDVRQLLPGAVDVVVAAPDPSSGQWRDQPSRTGRAPTELFSSYLAEQGVGDERVETLFAELLEDVHAS
jgi:exonuclease SbcD